MTAKDNPCSEAAEAQCPPLIEAEVHIVPSMEPGTAELTGEALTRRMGAVKERLAARITEADAKRVDAAQLDEVVRIVKDQMAPTTAQSTQGPPAAPWPSQGPNRAQRRAAVKRSKRRGR